MPHDPASDFVQAEYQGDYRTSYESPGHALARLLYIAADDIAYRLSRSELADLLDHVTPGQQRQQDAQDEKYRKIDDAAEKDRHRRNALPRQGMPQNRQAEPGGEAQDAAARTPQEQGHHDGLADRSQWDTTNQSESNQPALIHQHQLAQHLGDHPRQPQQGDPHEKRYQSDQLRDVRHPGKQHIQVAIHVDVGRNHRGTVMNCANQWSDPAQTRSQIPWREEPVTVDPDQVRHFRYKGWRSFDAVHSLSRDQATFQPRGNLLESRHRHGNDQASFRQIGERADIIEQPLVEFDALHLHWSITDPTFE
jgi:hypothetical protein